LCGRKLKRLRKVHLHRRGWRKRRREEGVNEAKSEDERDEEGECAMQLVRERRNREDDKERENGNTRVHCRSTRQYEHNVAGSW
jgi:hypothetical protein